MSITHALRAAIVCAALAAIATLNSSTLTAWRSVDPTGPLASIRQVTSETFSGVAQWLRAPRADMVSFSDTAAQQTAAIVQTDKADYQPGETATITGSGFGPSEEVTLQVTHVDGSIEGGAGHEPWTVSTDADGSFASTWFVEPDDSVGATMLLTAVGASGLTATATFTDAAIDFTQCINDDGGGSKNDGVIDPCSWETGAINQNNSKYTEGDAVAHRLFQVVAAAGEHTIRLTYDFSKLDVYAYDFLTSPDWSQGELLNQCGNVPSFVSFDACAGLFAGAAAVPVPSDPFDAVATRENPAARAIRVGGASSASLAIIRHEPGEACFQNCGTSEVTFEVRFVTDEPNTTVALWFGAHLAEAADPFGPAGGWGTGFGASSISGAPFHVSYKSLDGEAVGQRDNQMQGGQQSAVIPPGIVTIVKDAEPNDPQDFGFTGSFGGFSLDDDGDAALENSATFTSLLAGTYSVSETDIAGWTPRGAACSDGSDPSAIAVSAGETVVCTFINLKDQPKLTLEKLADPSTYSAVGERINYSYVLTNVGNVTLDGPFTVTDDRVTVSCPADATLAVDASIRCTAAYAITQDDLDLGSVTNVARGHGFYEHQRVDSNEDSQTVTAIQHPALDVVKGGTLDLGTDGIANPGDLINYTFTVTNTGNVTLTGVTVTDPLVAAISCPGTRLAPGASMTCTGSYAITQADIDAGTKHNVATTTGTPPGGGTVTADDDHDVSIPQTPAIDLQKSGSLNLGEDGIATPGDVISYTFAVRNTGNVTLTAVTLADTVSGVTVNGGPIASLVPGATDSTTFTGTYAITQADIDAGTKHNVAAITGTAPGGGTVTDDDDHTERVPQTPAIDIVKGGTPDLGTDGIANPGDLINYTFAVSNTGNVTLTGVTVTDPLVAVISCPATTLAPGTSMTCEGRYAITQADIDAGTRHNVAMADSDQSEPDRDDHDVSIPQTPAIDIAKGGTLDLGTDGIANPGDLINYTFAVSNTGNVTLTSVTVTDPLVAAISCPATTLAPGASMTCTGSYAITQADIDAGTKHNVATADSNQTPPDADDHDVSIPQTPAIDIVKTAALTRDADGSGAASPGDTLTYTFAVKNTGNVTLNPVSVSDPLPDLSAISCPASVLAPGASMSCSATLAVTAAHLAAGSIVNVAIATGKPPAGSDVSDTDDETVRLPRGQIIVRKQTLPDGDPQVFSFASTFGAFSLADNGEFSSGFLAPGTKSVTETPLTGWDQTSAVCSDGSGAGAISLQDGEIVTCTFTNTKRGNVNVTKLTKGVALTNPQVGDPGFWTFTLNGTQVSASHTTPPPTFNFGGAALLPGTAYTFCETNLPAGWTSTWKIDTGSGLTIIPMVFNVNTSPVGPDGYSQVYDPNYVAYPAVYANNTRCVKFVVEPGETVSFEVDNSFPGGDPRTIGFWKNWNTCTGGNQTQTAAKNGGAADGWFILDDLLNNPGYTLGLLQLRGTDCLKAVRILDKSDMVSGAKKASDPAYNMAAQLLAAMLNLSAGAETCAAAATAVNDGQAVLVGYKFTGTGDYAKKGTLATKALALTPILDKYNNGNLCN